jgi:hypothetical protein
MSDAELLRSQILDMTGEYARIVFEKDSVFTLGETHVPVSGKLIGKEELKFADDPEFVNKQNR